MITIEEYINSFDSGTLIYPNQIANKFGMTIRETYAALVPLLEEDLIDTRIQMFCDKCGLVGNIIQVISEIPEEFECPICKSVYKNTLKHSVIIFIKK